jgi:4-hydroxy 2-oxovalerate aldolase
MNLINLLDCTLRDGGFVNDWKFGFGSIKNIISRLNSACVDIIEVGFIDERREYDENRSIFPDTNSILPIFHNINKPSSTIVGMIDFGTCSIKKISYQNESCLDGIRVIFKKKDQDEAISFLYQIKEKGYKVFVNPVSITSYTNEETLKLAEKINKLDPYCVSVVDTYGLMHSQEVLNYFNIFDQNLNPCIMLGYHAHNNFQMAYANSIALMNKKLSRPVVVDGSLYGMGKSAGNACTELLAMYMNEFCNRNFKLEQILESIDVDIQKEYHIKPWGYKIEYYLAALNDCHPSYVQYFVDKKTLSVRDINTILSRISVEKKLSFDNVLAEMLYNDYQNKYCDDLATVESLKNAFAGKKLLVLGPGRTLQDYQNVITEFILQNKPVIISVNFFNDQVPSDYVFMGNAKRYSQFFHKIYENYSKIKIICTSNITEAGETINYKVNYASLLAKNIIIKDNPLIMFLHLLEKMQLEKVYLAGFDGYASDNAVNYYNEYLPFLYYCEDDVIPRNEAIKSELRAMSSKILINSLTPTKYI